MALPVSFGRPWVHEVWGCDGCDVSPVVGNLYMSNKRHNYGLCSKCQRQNQEEDLVYKIGRSKETRPFQIHCIDCDKCGVSPIEGPRYQHKVKQNFNLCADCFSEATSCDAEEERKLFDLVEHTAVKSMCKTHQPVFHFNVTCNECRADPVCGPVYKSVKDSDYDLCLTCFDSRLTKKKIDAHDFKPIFRPKASQAIHVLIYACSHCNATPICGPAYISQKNPEKVLCLLCFLNTTPAKQSVYQRREPPLEFDEETMDPEYDPAAAAAEGGGVEKQAVSHASGQFLLLQMQQNMAQQNMAIQMQQNMAQNMLLSQMRHNNVMLSLI